MKISKANFSVMSDTKVKTPEAAYAEAEKHVKNAVADPDKGASEYAEAEKYIKKALELLGAKAKDDPKAKEAVANLGVTLLDLRS